MSEVRTYLTADGGEAGSGDAGLSQQKLNNERENALLFQCLQFTRDIIKSRQQFSITIRLSNGCNFEFRNIKEKELPPKMKQK